MERTKVISVVNNTAKAPKNQGFLEKWFQSGHSFSSAVRKPELEGFQQNRMEDRRTPKPQRLRGVSAFWSGENS